MKPTTKGLRDLFPRTKPYRSGYLEVSKLHTIHFEEYGNPHGKPLVFLHGGPGGGIEPFYHRYFDPKKWRIVLHDQRGCGKSTPFSELRENTTWHLVADIETLREHLGIDRWVVFGGAGAAPSRWHTPRRTRIAARRSCCAGSSSCAGASSSGSTRRARARSFPTRGSTTSRRSRARAGRHDEGLLQAPHQPRPPRAPEGGARLVDLGGEHEQAVLRPGAREEVGRGRFADAFARIEAHYFVNRGFMKPDDQLLRDVRKIRRIPGVIVQGRYDVVCPIRSAWDLHRAWPEARLVIVPDAGHSMTEPGIRSALIEETGASRGSSAVGPTDAVTRRWDCS